jgi:transcription initiation factor TFIID TATA-box-binding protein
MADKRYESLKIENIVASGVIADSIDLAEVSKKIPSCELNTKRFPGAVYRIEKPKIASLIFSSGKVVLTGIRDKDALDDGLNLIISSLKKAGVRTYKEPKVAITNIVCSYDIGKYINLNKVVITLNLENIEYEPEQFPGLVYRIDKPKVVLLLFGSGKVVCTGARKPSDVEEAIEKIMAELKSNGMLH